MSRVAGRSPLAPIKIKPVADELADEDHLPPHLPYVLLCHASGAMCGMVFTVNRASQWRSKHQARQAHENLCLTPPRVELILPY